MFGKKRRGGQSRVVALDGSGAIVWQCPAEDFQLPEAATLALSVEFFNDPEPCEIHCAAVRWRALQQLKELSGGQPVPIGALEAPLRACFPEGTSAVRVEEAAP